MVDNLLKIEYFYQKKLLCIHYLFTNISVKFWNIRCDTFFLNSQKSPFSQAVKLVVPLKARWNTRGTLWSAREIASVALSAEQERHTDNVFHIALRRVLKGNKTGWAFWWSFVSTWKCSKGYFSIDVYDLRGWRKLFNYSKCARQYCISSEHIYCKLWSEYRRVERWCRVLLRVNAFYEAEQTGSFRIVKMCLAPTGDKTPVT